MTRKDYVLIAVALRDTLLIDCPTEEFLNGAIAARDSAVLRVADALGRDNPRFDRERFLKACGVQS
jgi:hypothetical protein